MAVEQTGAFRLTARIPLFSWASPPFSMTPLFLSALPLAAYLTAVLAFLLALGVTAMATLWVRQRALRYGWGVDLPDGERKLHAAPTPAIGGVAIAFGFAVALSLYAGFQWVADPSAQTGLPGAALWLGALVMVLTGLYDDVKGLSFKGKFAIQIIVAYGLIQAGYRIDVSVLPFVSDDVYGHAMLSIPLTMLWIVGVINAVNLLDGLDGLAAGVSLIAFSALGLVFGTHGEVGLVMVALLLAGALVGFLIFNFNPASIFMGDSGSLFLGYLLAAYSLVGVGAISNGPDPWMALLVPAVALGLPLLDTSLSIVRRLRERKAIFAPDSDHIHHRMAARYPHRGAVLRLYSAAFIFGVSAYLISLLPTLHALGVLSFTGFIAMIGLQRLGYHKPTFTGGTDRSAHTGRVDVVEDSSMHLGMDGEDAGIPEPFLHVPEHVARGDGHLAEAIVSTRG